MTTNIRLLRIRSTEKILGLKEGEHLSVNDLNKLIKQNQEFLEHCGIADPAHEYLIKINYHYNYLRFHLLAEEFQLDINLMESMLSMLGDKRLRLFDLTEDELFDIASEWDAKRTKPGVREFERKSFKRAADSVLAYMEWRAKQDWVTAPRH